MYGVTEEETRNLVSVIDYSEALTITATEDDVRAACEEAKSYGFRTIQHTHNAPDSANIRIIGEGNFIVNNILSGRLEIAPGSARLTSNLKK